MKPRFVTLSAIFALALLAFGRPAWDFARARVRESQEARSVRAGRERVARLRTLNEAPPENLPRRAGDRVRYPRETFAIKYLDDNGFGIDTVSGVANYDRISDPDTSFGFRLTSAQLDSLYEEALNDRLFEMEQPRPIGMSWAGSDHWGGVLTLRAAESERSLRWDIWDNREQWTDDHKRLNAFVQNLKRMVKTSPAYLAQPHPGGVYID